MVSHEGDVGESGSLSAISRRSLEPDYKDPELLRVLLRQGCQQYGIDMKRCNGGVYHPTHHPLQVGENGGLIYLLFPQIDIKTVLPDSLDKLQSLVNFRDAAQQHLSAGTTVGMRHSFSPVTQIALPERRLAYNVVLGFQSVPLRYLGIGTPSVASHDDLERFLEMVQEGRAELQESYGVVQDTLAVLQDVKCG